MFWENSARDGGEKIFDHHLKKFAVFEKPWQYLLVTETFIPRSSESLDQASYDEAEKVLTVTFKDGTSWEYRNVPRETFMGLQHAPSAGSYFYRNIRSRFVGAEV